MRNNPNVDEQNESLLLNMAGNDWMVWYNKVYFKNVFSSGWWAEFRNKIGLFTGDQPEKTRSYRIADKKLRKYCKRLDRALSENEQFWDDWKDKHGNLSEEKAEEAKKELDRILFGQACFLTAIWCEAGGLITEYEKETARFLFLGADCENLACMVELGRCYLYGVSVPKSAKESIKWFATAAEAGDAYAAFELGRIRELGIGGIQKDFAKAWYWYKKSAEAGYPEAQYRVGVMLEEGRDIVHFREIGLDAVGIDSVRLKVPQLTMPLHKEFRYNYSEAVKWYRLAANQHHPEALYRLGLCYFNGVGVEQNDFLAYELFTEASRKGSKDAAYMSSVCVESNRGCHFGRFQTRRRLQEEGFRQARDRGHVSADERLYALALSGRRIQFYSGPNYALSLSRRYQSCFFDATLKAQLEEMNEEE